MRCTDPSVFQQDPLHHFDTGLPLWNPATLLEPQRQPLSSAPTSVYGGSQPGGPEESVFSFQNSTPTSRPMSNLPNDLVFHFAGPGTDDGYLSSGDQINADFIGGARGIEGLDDIMPPDVPDVAAPSSSNGMASMIERGFMLQDRVDIPEPKRRKVATGEPAEVKPFLQSASNGILARAIKEERSEDKKSLPSASTATAVDAAAAVKTEVKTESKPFVKSEPEVPAPITVDLTEGLSALFSCSNSKQILTDLS